MAVGYEFLRQSLGLPIPPIRRPATVQPVIRVGPGAHDTLAIPALVAPQSDDPLEHVLFALKHEERISWFCTTYSRRYPPSESCRNCARRRPAALSARPGTCGSTSTARR
jgi:hypothetical protein